MLNCHSALVEPSLKISGSRFLVRSLTRSTSILRFSALSLRVPRLLALVSRAVVFSSIVVRRVSIAVFFSRAAVLLACACSRLLASIYCCVWVTSCRPSARSCSASVLWPSSSPFSRSRVAFSCSTSDDKVSRRVLSACILSNGLVAVSAIVFSLEYFFLEKNTDQDDLYFCKI